MKVKFKRPVSIDGKDYSIGNHELMEELLAHWFLKGLVMDGHAEMVDLPKEPVAVVVEAEAKSEAAPKAKTKKA